MINEAKSRNKPVIFVTIDLKEDWWWIHNKEHTVGPRPELRREFLSEAGHHFFMYRSGQFLEHAGKFVDESVSQGVIDEVRQVGPNMDTFDIADAQVRRGIRNLLAHGQPTNRDFNVTTDELLRLIQDSQNYSPPSSPWLDYLISTGLLDLEQQRHDRAIAASNWESLATALGPTSLEFTNSEESLGGSEPMSRPTSPRNQPEPAEGANDSED